MFQRIFLILFCVLAGGFFCSCATPSDVQNVPASFYAHNLSQKIVPVVFDEKEEATEESPTLYKFLVEKNILHDGKLIIPKDSELSCVSYYPDNPQFFVINNIRLSGNMAYTPAQGIVTITTGDRGIATLSMVTIPK